MKVIASTVVVLAAFAATSASTKPVNLTGYGAVYSPDGITVQFDNGTIWQRGSGAATAQPLLGR
jgi:hypothetical protein